MEQEFFVIQHDTTGEFVSGIDNGQPTFSASESDAEWSFREDKVVQFIFKNNIQNVKAVPGQGGNHPPNPPISA